MSIVPDISGILETMYTDTLTVWEYAETTDSDGATITVKNSDLKFTSSIPCCRISYKMKDSPVKQDDSNGVNIMPTLICRPDIPLENGDYVEVKRHGQVVYCGNIGLPNIHGSSQQVLFLDKRKS